MAAGFGAIPMDAGKTDPVSEIRDLTGGKGVDVSLELVGLPLTMHQAVMALGIGGRAALAGITDRAMEIVPYHELINKEAAVIGVSDHLAQEIPLLLELARTGRLRLTGAVTRTVPLDASAINLVLDDLDRFGSGIRAVIRPDCS